ncbi:transcriptional regulator TyrR [Flocculibacter collagenilyticus]|uniref:transcriptional regulator TyrR n=1 Tax=Flocculibacter collagenilyticus TaxID=2744479 RepID=UPI0018F6535A|nr:transcriptional regulator TyrR [Flocculibacter collagenilyticus]
MRLEIFCEDRIGIALDVLNILVKHEIDLKGIEVDPLTNKMFVSFPQIEFEKFQIIMPEIRKIEGVKDVKTTSFMPSEREHNELAALLTTLPDGIISIDVKGNVLIANNSALNELNTNLDSLQEENINHTLKGFNFVKWLEQDEVLAQTNRLQANNENYIADILPIYINDDEDSKILAGAVITLKSESRLGQQVTVFRRHEQESFNNIVAVSTQMRRIVREAKKMSLLDAPVLLMGETGTGKEIVARACHNASERKDAPFLTLSCASLPDNVAESELFGYGMGAYENAVQGKRGILEQADGGTVFLDEVGEMSSELQTKFLRFLQDGSFRRVGEENEVNVNVRVICTTQKDLPGMVQEGAFREDLFYRLNVLTIEIAPLRERKQDILPLCQAFIQKYSRQLGRSTPSLDEACQQFVQQYPWPGNVRQLENALYRAVTLLEGDYLTKEHLQLPSYNSNFGYLDQDFDGTLEEAVKRFEATVLRKLYPAYPSSRQLAKKLGLSHTAVANKLRDYGINRKTVKV